MTIYKYDHMRISTIPVIALFTYACLSRALAATTCCHGNSSYSSACRLTPVGNVNLAGGRPAVGPGPISPLKTEDTPGTGEERLCEGRAGPGRRRAAHLCGRRSRGSSVAAAAAAAAITLNQ
jgi:hypothetical protein